MKTNNVLIVLALFSAPLMGRAQLSVTGVQGTTADADALANTLLGPGFTLIGDATYVGNTTGSGLGTVQQGGTFTGGASAGITINSGVLLTTGTVQNAVGPNNSPSTTQNWGAAGTPELNNLASVVTGNAGSHTYDANTLTFNFNAATAGTLYFNYVFGSEEYNEWVGDYNDVFGFFLDGTHVSNDVALVPGTSTPVSIDSINLNSNSQYYINNSTGTGTGYTSDPAAPLPLADIQYDGFTVPLQVSADISAGNHTISLEIADTGDGNYDSGVFIQGGSFSSAPTPTGVPDAGATLSMVGGGLACLAALRRRFAK